MPTVQEFLTQIRDALDEPLQAQFTDDMLRRWLNEANRDLARSTHHYTGNYTVPAVSSVSTYTLSSDVLAVQHVWFDDGRAIELTARHMEQLSPIMDGSHDRVGRPVFYTTEGFSPSLTLRIYPTPVFSTPSNILLLCSRIPDDIPTSDAVSTPVDVPSAWFDALSDYVEFKALRRDRDPRWQEAFQLYSDKRDGLIHNPDALPVFREVTPDPRAGFVPSWLAEFG